MYLQALEEILESVGRFLQNQTYTSILQRGKQYNIIAMFSKDLRLLSKQIEIEMTGIKNPEYLLQNYSNQEYSDIQKGGKEQPLDRKDYESMQPILKNSSDRFKQEVNLSKTEKEQGKYMYKYKPIKPWLETLGFQMILKSLSCATKYQNQIKQIFQYTLINENQLENYGQNFDTSNLQIEQKKSLGQSLQGSMYAQIAEVILKMKEIHSYLLEIKPESKNENSQPLSVSNNSNQSLLTKMLNQTVLTPLTYSTKKKSREIRRMQEIDGTQQHRIQSAKTPLQSRKYSRNRKFSIRSEEHGLIVKQFNLQNYELCQKPKQKKTHNNINYGNCSKCTIF